MPAPGNVRGFNHAGVTVASLDASLRFYRDALGLEVVFNRRLTDSYIFAFTGSGATAVNTAFLAVPGSDAMIELLEYEGVDRRPAASRPSDPANAHMCLVVDDLDAVFARLTAGGFRAQSPSPVAIPVGPTAGGKLLYAVDPDGAYVELVEPPPGR